MMFWWFIASSFLCLLCVLQQLKTIFESSFSICKQFCYHFMTFPFQIIFLASYSFLENILASFDILPDLLIDTDILSSLLVTFFGLLHLSLLLYLSDGKHTLSEDLNNWVKLLFICGLKAWNILGSKQIFIYCLQLQFNISQTSTSVIHLLRAPFIIKWLDSNLKLQTRIDYSEKIMFLSFCFDCLSVKSIASSNPTVNVDRYNYIEQSH